MIAHSVIVALLNITGHSPLTMAMSTTPETIIALTGAVFIAAGMFMTFVIIFKLIELIEGLTSNMSKKILDNLITIMLLLFILAGISSVFVFMPLVATAAMGALLLLGVLFLITYYNVFLAKNKTHA